jgi:hypothetical protein
MGHTCFPVKTKILISSWLHKFKFGSHTTEAKSSGKDEIKKKNLELGGNNKNAISKMITLIPLIRQLLL